MEQGRLILPQLLEVNKSQGWCNKSTRSELRSFRESSKANGGAPGVDGETLEDIERQGVDNVLRDLQTQLSTKRYRPLPVRRTYIPKPGKTEKRGLGIPRIRDRIVQAAAKIVLEPIFEADFADCSYGFRPKRSAHDAEERIRQLANEGRDWVVDADIRAYFDSTY